MHLMKWLNSVILKNKLVRLILAGYRWSLYVLVHIVLVFTVESRMV